MGQAVRPQAEKTPHRPDRRAGTSGSEPRRVLGATPLGPRETLLTTGLGPVVVPTTAGRLPRGLPPRRVDRVDLRLDGDRVLATATGVWHRMPRTRSVDPSAALGLLGRGVPTFLQVPS